jgi:hypothetical protein
MLFNVLNVQLTLFMNLMKLVVVFVLRQLLIHLLVVVMLLPVLIAHLISIIKMMDLVVVFVLNPLKNLNIQLIVLTSNVWIVLLISPMKLMVHVVVSVKKLLLKLKNPDAIKSNVRNVLLTLLMKKMDLVAVFVPKLLKNQLKNQLMLILVTVLTVFHAHLISPMKMINHVVVSVRKLLLKHQNLVVMLFLV